MTQANPTWKPRVQSLLVSLAILCAIVWFLDRSINPRDINHLILIREVPDAESIPDRALLEGDVNWEQSLEFHGFGQGRENSLSTADIFHPWSGGTFSIYDRDGDLLTSVKLRPPGRYCGGLVILITKEAGLLTAKSRQTCSGESGYEAKYFI